MRKFLIAGLGTGLALALSSTAVFADPLPSWTGASKSRIVEFVEQVTDADGADYVPIPDRVAVFDNDGTLWAEQPLYFQLIFAIDQIAEMAAMDPSVLTSDTLKAAAEGDYKTVLAGGEDALIEVLKATHTDITVTDFQRAVSDWLAATSHPTTGLPYDQMTYQPMLELLRYLRDEDFTTYIVSGGGVHFMRVFAEQAYGIPPNQVIGSSTVTSYKVVDGLPVIIKEPALGFNDDKEGKPVAIELKIGKRPILAGGNSDGDFQMLEWTSAGDGPSLALIVHHTDADREWAYDRDSHIGGLERGLDEGPDRGWQIIDMAQEWTRIYSGAE